MKTKVYFKSASWTGMKTCVKNYKTVLLVSVFGLFSLYHLHKFIGQTPRSTPVFLENTLKTSFGYVDSAIVENTLTSFSMKSTKKDEYGTKNVKQRKHTFMRKIILRRLPYPNDPDCQNFSKNLYVENSFSMTSLVSFPGSGNTWVRHLIELASGIYTGSVYADVDLIVRGFIGEREPWNSGSTIVQKMHVRFSENLNVTRAILIIREPYKAIVSFVQYLESGHLGQASIHTFQRKEFERYILHETYNWLTLAKTWIEGSLTLLVIHYEQLQGRNLIPVLEKVCKFLNITCENLYSKCFKNHEEGAFHRKQKLQVLPRVPSWVQEKVDRGIDYLNSLLIQHGHPSIPLHHYIYYKKTAATFD